MLTQITEPTGPKYPNVYVHIELEGPSGNALAILGLVRKALRREGVPHTELKEFFAEATSDDYKHVLATVKAWVDTNLADEEESDGSG